MSWAAEQATTWPDVVGFGMILAFAAFLIRTFAR